MAIRASRTRPAGIGGPGVRGEPLHPVVRAGAVHRHAAPDRPGVVRVVGVVGLGGGSGVRADGGVGRQVEPAELVGAEPARALAQRPRCAGPPRHGQVEHQPVVVHGDAVRPADLVGGRRPGRPHARRQPGLRDRQAGDRDLRALAVGDGAAGQRPWSGRAGNQQDPAGPVAGHAVGGDPAAPSRVVAGRSGRPARPHPVDRGRHRIGR